MPSDAPTRPISSYAPIPRSDLNGYLDASNANIYGQNKLPGGGEGFYAPNPGYMSGLNANNHARAHNRQSQPGYSTFGAGSSLVDVRVDNSPTDMSIFQESYVPPPSLDIPDSRIAARYHNQRGNVLGIEAALAERHATGDLAALPAIKQQHVQEIYTALRLANLNVPSSASKPLLPNDLYAAVSHLFQFVSPLPEDYTPTAQGTAYLLQLLGYSEERLEVDIFALRMPHRNAAWPVIVEMLWWLFELAQAMPDSNEDWLSDQRIQTNMDFERYLEYASASAFPLQSDIAEPSLPEEYVSEIKQTLEKYNIDTAAAVEEEQQALSESKEKLSLLEQENSGMTGDVKKCEELERDNENLQSSVSNAANKAHELREEICRLQTQTDEMRRREAENEREMELLHQEILVGGVSSVDEFVQLAETYRDLKSRHFALSSDVQSLRTRFTEEYERPTRQRLTAIRIALDEYNDGTPVESTLIDSKDLSTNLDDIWGRSIASLLGENSDLRSLKCVWRELEVAERKKLEELEDVVSGLDAEIKSLENRLKVHVSKAEEIRNVTERLEHEKDTTSEAIATIQHQRLRRKERTDHCKMLLSALKNSTETLVRQNARLTEETQQTESSIQRAIGRKQSFEMIFLEYQNAYSLLEDKIDQLEKANVGLSQAKLDAEMWINDLKPRPVSGQAVHKASSGTESSSEALNETLLTARHNAEKFLQNS